MSKTLVILAAGIGSRFGGGIKQLEPVDDAGHIIMDYSIHDAIAAGFDTIIFVIRKDIEQDFRDAIGRRIERVCSILGVDVKYAFQNLGDIPDFEGREKVEGRTKPYGTGHAVLACRDLIDSPFSVINADDYYGKTSFQKAADFLFMGYGLVGYRLKNTLSPNGGVTRAICEVDSRRLVRVKETSNIVSVGRLSVKADGVQLDPNALVSMNFWCYPIDFLDTLTVGFKKFLETIQDPMKDEYLLPVIADRMLKGGAYFAVLPTEDKWFGVTYKEDKPSVVKGFKNLIFRGVYQEDLYDDLLW